MCPDCLSDAFRFFKVQLRDLHEELQTCGGGRLETNIIAQFRVITISDRICASEMRLSFAETRCLHVCLLESLESLVFVGAG